MWREASEEIKRPYLERTAANRRSNEQLFAKWKGSVTEWERRTYEVKDRWCADNPFEKFGLQPPSDKLEASRVGAKSGEERARKIRKLG
jgi:lysine-specific histone demethylase 1